MPYHGDPHSPIRAFQPEVGKKSEYGVHTPNEDTGEEWTLAAGSTSDGKKTKSSCPRRRCKDRAPRNETDTNHRPLQRVI